MANERTFQVYDIIKQYIEEHRYPPTLREIGNRVGLSSTSNVRYHIDELEKLGMLKREKGVARGIVICEEGSRE